MLRRAVHTWCVVTQAGATEWIEMWRNNDWQRSNGEFVKNRNKMEMLDDLLNDDRIDVQWVSIVSHSTSSPGVSMLCQTF